MESFFIAMEVLVIKIRLLVEPHGQRERAPAAFLVDHNLTAFEFGTGWPFEPTIIPNRLGLFELTVIGPENGTRIFELFGFKQELWIHYRNIIRVQKQHFAKWRMQNRVRFQFPASENASGAGFSDSESVDTVHAQGFEQCFHMGTHLLPPKIPELNRQRAAQVTQHVNAYPGAWKILDAAATDHN